jgi:hypothetical protein
MKEERTSSQQSRLYISLSPRTALKWRNDVQETTTGAGAASELDSTAEELALASGEEAAEEAAEEEGEEDKQESSPPPTFIF